MSMIDDFILKAKEFFKNEKYNECLDCCDMILGLSSCNIDVFIIKMEVFIKVGFYKEALEEIKIVESMGIEDSRIDIINMNILIALGKVNEVIEYTKLDIDKSVFNKICKRLLNEEKYEILIEYCDMLISERRIDTDCYLNKVKALVFLNRIKEALDVIKEVLNSDLPHKEKYIFYRGRIFVKLNNISDGIKEYKKAIKLNKKYSAAYRELADIYNLLGKYDEALNYALNALQLSPRNEKNYVVLIKIYYNLEDYNSCMKVCQSFIECFNDVFLLEVVRRIHSSCCSKLGKISKEKGELIKSSKEYDKLNKWLDFEGILS